MEKEILYKGIYNGLFKTGQYGKLYIISEINKFQIFITPKNENINDKSNIVEVYGVKNTEDSEDEKYEIITYGWLHKGKWCDDFEQLLLNAKENKKTRELKERQEFENRIKIEAERIKTLLELY